MKIIHENAVSPVVGVMLMLVVVIIIAAIVSGFAGSLAQTNNKAPQASISGTLYVNGSSNNFVILNHLGGDELITGKTTILLKRGDDWGPYVGILASGSDFVANKSKIHDSYGKYWFNINDGGMDVPVWRSGEIMYYDLSSNSFTSDDVGKKVDLEILTTDGKMISKTKMPILP